MNVIVKKMTMLAVVIMCSVALQAQNALFEKYADDDNVSITKISKSMIGMMGNVKTADKKVLHLTSKIQSIRILSTEKGSLVRPLLKESLDLMQKEGYEEVLSQKDKNERTYIMVKRLGNVKKGMTAHNKTGNEAKVTKRVSAPLYEYVVINVEKDEFSLVDIVGYLNLGEIQKFSGM